MRKIRSLIGFDFACAGFSSNWYAGLVNNVTKATLSGGNVHNFDNFKPSNQLAKSNAFNLCELQSKVFRLFAEEGVGFALRIKEEVFSSANSKNQCTKNP